MATEAVSFIEPDHCATVIDATLGLGGHSEAILNASPVVSVIGIDQDTEAIAHAGKRLEKFGSRICIVHSNFSEIEKVALNAGLEEVDAIIADLGVSSLQLDSDTRGFSFRFDAPLDMRMDPDSEGETAAELLERLTEKEIADIIYLYGEERHSRRIARKIVEKRDAGEPVKTTSDLAGLVRRAIGRGKRDKIDPATRTFQALRIAVNDELEILEQFVKDAISILSPGGTLVIITFHSLEDRIVKRAMQKASGRCFCPPKFPKCVCGMIEEVTVLTRKPVVPSETEQSENPRARSAKLRACQKKN
jgi:16S rRNA (cytosine1402-N4)-methyltransferase